jgi:effector-binding domain-containing protein
MGYEFTIHEVPELRVLSIRGRFDSAAIQTFLGRSFADLYGHVGMLGAQPTGHPFVIYHDIGGDSIDAEVCVPIAATVTASGRIASRALEPGQVVRTLHVGPYDQLHVAYEALDAWIRDRGFEVVGPVRERYLNGPDEGESPAGYRTEIEMPVVPARATADV